MKTSEYINEINEGALDERLRELYVDEAMVPRQRERYIALLQRYEQTFGEGEVMIISTPGRSEICGNHTDHQRGMVLAASVNLDLVAVVSPAESEIIVWSDGYPVTELASEELSVREEEKGTTKALIRGVLAGLKQAGYKIGGFKACITGNVPAGAGLSSSAAFEGLIGCVISALYNDIKIPATTIAKVGQFAENVYFGKPCGLMDQMACCVGGLIAIDFKDAKEPLVKEIPCDLGRADLALCIVNTGGSHADLTDDYAAVPAEMRSVAEAAGREVLRDLPEEEFYEQLPAIAEKVSPRAVLRAIHFYEEEKRVMRAVSALEKEDFADFLAVVEDSGNSSAVNLQNLYSNKAPLDQKIPMALALTKQFLGSEGVCRVHGGGFAGTILVFLKSGAAPAYKAWIERFCGEGSCHVLRVRPVGCTVVEL